ncbi:MAG: hypothetical protein ABI539_13900 [Acidobacteriota bacterium]
MRLRHWLIMICIVSVSALTAYAQEPPTLQPDPSPTPVRTVKRRTFDQFDLSNGISLPSLPQTSVSGPAYKPAAIELLSEDKFEVIGQLIGHSKSVEAEYRSVLQQNIDPFSNAPYQKHLRHDLMGILRVSEVQRVGMFGQTPLRSESNLSLLNENEDIVNMMIVFLELDKSRPNSLPKELIEVCRIYGFTLALDDAASQRLPLFDAMFTRLNRNFERLKSQIATGK